MRGPRQVFVLWCCLAACSAIVTSHTVALGAEAETQGPPPTVSFADQQPLSLDTPELKKLAEADGVAVDIHNALDHSQRVSLEVVGFDEASTGELFTSTRDTHSVPAGHTSTFRLSLVQPLPKIGEGTHTATLLAYGASGGLSHRELTIAGPPPGGEEEQAGENSLSPSRPIDITMQAVNYVPSLLSSLYALGIFFALALIIAAFLFKEWLQRRSTGLPTALLAAGVLAGVLSLAGVIADGAWDQPGIHAISPEPIALSPKVPAGTRGAVSSEDGTIAQLIAADRKLHPENLSGADKYTGKYNLSDEAGKVEATATVIVHDYWIWAAIAITIGLGVGSLLHRWFQEKRPKAKLRARLDQLRHNYEADLGGTKDHYEGGPQRDKDVRIDSRLLDREAEINSLLEAGEATAATEKLLALGVYLDRFSTLREKRRNLDNALAELKRTPNWSRLKFDLVEARGYEQACKLLETSADPSGLDSDEAELKERIVEVNTETKLIERTSSQVKKSIWHLLAVDALRPAVHEKQMEELGSLEVKLIEAGQQALQADSLEDLEEAETADDGALRKLKALSRQIEVGPHASDVQPVSANPALMTRDVLAAGGAEATLVQLAFKTPQLHAPDVSARISWVVLNEDGSQATDIHVEDHVQFSIEFQAEAQPPFPEVEIDFGEGIAVEYTVPILGTPLIVTHRYRRAVEKPVVVVRSVPEGAELGQNDLPSIEAEPRPLKSQRQLAESDKLVDRAAFVLAVGSGMVALYFADPSWGQPVDYLGAFLWGGATGEGVKFAAAIADRVWPVA